VTLTVFVKSVAHRCTQNLKTNLDKKLLVKNGGGFFFSFSSKKCLPLVKKCSYKGDGHNLNRDLSLSWNILVNICFNNKNHLSRARISKGSAEYLSYFIIQP